MVVLVVISGNELILGMSLIKMFFYLSRYDPLNVLLTNYENILIIWKYTIYIKEFLIVKYHCLGQKYATKK